MIYLDNAATTKMAEEVMASMLPFFMEVYGNPSSMYSLGFKAKKAVNQARRTIAASIGAKMEEIYFTSGGTDADNWALRGIAEAYKDKGRHIITTKIEHHAVLHTCEALAKEGFEVTFLDVDSTGLVHPKQIADAIRPDTILISVIFANNEIGVIEPIGEIGSIAKERGILFHTDAVQAFGHVSIQVDEMSIDMLSASAHKLNGPKGIGFLYVREGIHFKPSLYGGTQERKKRAGTENVPGIVGFGAAVERMCRIMEEKGRRERELRDYLIHKIETEIPCCRLNGHRERRLTNNVHFSFPFIEGETLLIHLDMKGICASSGSACSSSSADMSHVLLGIGLHHEEARGSLRMSLSEENTEEELDFVVETIKNIVEKLRAMSPLYEQYTEGKE